MPEIQFSLKIPAFDRRRELVPPYFPCEFLLSRSLGKSLRRGGALSPRERTRLMQNRSVDNSIIIARFFVV